MLRDEMDMRDPAKDDGATTLGFDLPVLEQIARRVLWLSTRIVDTANHDRPDAGGIRWAAIRLPRPHSSRR